MWEERTPDKTYFWHIYNLGNAIKYTGCGRKNIPDIFDCNFNKKYQILIIFLYEYFWHNLTLNDYLAYHLTHCLLLHYLGKADQAQYVLKYTKYVKNILNIIEH